MSSCDLLLHMVGEADELDFQFKQDSRILVDRAPCDIKECKHVGGFCPTEIDDKVRVLLRDLRVPDTFSLQSRLFNELCCERSRWIFEHAAGIRQAQRLRQVP